jgi:hypothetical protein
MEGRARFHLLEFNALVTEKVRSLVAAKGKLTHGLGIIFLSPASFGETKADHTMRWSAPLGPPLPELEANNAARCVYLGLRSLEDTLKFQKLSIEFLSGLFLTAHASFFRNVRKPHHVLYTFRGRTMQVFD